MEKPVEVNKWAAIYRAITCCNAPFKVSAYTPFIVERIETINTQCPFCGAVRFRQTTVRFNWGDKSRWAPLEIVRRLPDSPPEPEAEPRAADLPAPIAEVLTA